jgi:hypothetical protein
MADRMETSEGLAMARRQLNEIKERHVRNPESDTATEQQDQNAA